MAIVYGVTGHHTQMAIYIGFATLCLIDILVELGVPGKVRAEGPKGKIDFKTDTKADTLAQNRAQGKAYEQQQFAKFSSQNSNAVAQITIKTESGVKTRVDALGIDSNGEIFYYSTIDY